jgi:hypothetical protein
MWCPDSEAVGTYGGRRGVSGGVSAETMTVPGGTAHLAWRRLAAAVCGARIAALDSSLDSGWQSAAAGNGEARRSRGGGARAVAWAAALCSDRGHGTLGHGAGRNGSRSERGAFMAQARWQCRPGQPIRAPTSRPHTLALFLFQKYSKITFRRRKNGYKVRKNLRKFLKVGNQIQNTFHH